MRPKDENQHGSMRPNLMSSAARRASSEENILAMLERDSARRGSSSRMAWYGVGSALALVLVSALAWLAYDNGALRDDQLLTPVAVAAPVTVVTAAGPRPAAIQPARAATIVDAPPEPTQLAEAAPSPAPDEAPPLVLLSPSQAAAAEEPAPAPKAVPKHAAPKAVQARKRTHAKAAAAKAPRAKSAPAHVATHQHQAAQTAAPAKARVKKAAAAVAQAGDAPSDSDVALISAIIGHANRHAAERTQTGSCADAADNKCGSRP